MFYILLELKRLSPALIPGLVKKLALPGVVAA
jgi:hypothetical protein